MIRLLFCKDWWKYLFSKPFSLRRFWCRVRNHPNGAIWCDPIGVEPDMRCVDCGEYLG